MNKEIVNELYQKVLETSNGTKIVRADFHVHTPASRDFNCGCLETKEAYINLLDQCLKNGIQVIAITDHNTFRGYNKIKEILKDTSLNEKYSSILILQGIEISCFSKHIIAVFPDSFDETKQNSFLREIGIDSTTEGTEEALADNFGPAVLIEKIGGHNGFVILAHADSNKGFLQKHCGKSSGPNGLDFDGKSLAKIIKSPSLFGIQCNSDTNKIKIEGLLKNYDYKRPDRKLAFLKGSDCHGVVENGQYSAQNGVRIGSCYSNIKLSEVTCDALKMALLDSEMRVCFDENVCQYGYILGVAVKSKILSTNNQYAFFHFNTELNCIIGARGTGKTTLLEILQSVVAPSSLNERDLNNVFSKYSSAVVYLKSGNDIYAISYSPILEEDGYTREKTNVAEPKIYHKKESAKKFRICEKGAQPKNLRVLLTVGYHQRQLFDYSRNPDKILDIVDDFINWKKDGLARNLKQQIENQKIELSKLLREEKQSRDQRENFAEFLSNNGKLDRVVRLYDIINRKKADLRKIRQQMIDELNEVLKGKVKIELASKLENEQWEQDIEKLAVNSAKDAGKYYDYQIHISQLLKRIYYYIKHRETVFDFYVLLLEEKHQDILKEFSLRELKVKDLENIRKSISSDDLLTFLDDKLCLKYNIKWDEI